MTMEYNKVFISYKRFLGSSWAEMLYLGLIHYCKFEKDKIIMDVHNFSGKDFTKPQIIIKNCVNVIVIISPGCLEAIHENERDFWLEEIQYAIECKRNIIPFYCEVDPSDFEKDVTNNKNYSILSNLFKNKIQIVSYSHDNPESAINQVGKICKDKIFVQTKISIISRFPCSISENYGSDSAWKDIKRNESFSFFIDKDCDREIEINAVREIPNQKDLNICYHLMFRKYANKKFKEGIRNNNSPYVRYQYIKENDDGCYKFNLEWEEQEVSYMGGIPQHIYPYSFPDSPFLNKQK